MPDYLLAAGAALLGLTPYLLPLVRFLQGGGPYYWGDPQTWGDFVRLLSGQDFRHMVFGIPWTQFGPQVGWGVQVLLDQYGWPGVIVGLVGWAVLARRQPLVFGMLAAGFVFSFVFAIMYDAATNYFYFIPGHLFWALALGVAGEAALAALPAGAGHATRAGQVTRWRWVALAAALVALLVAGAWPPATTPPAGSTTTMALTERRGPLPGRPTHCHRLRRLGGQQRDQVLPDRRGPRAPT